MRSVVKAGMIALLAWATCVGAAERVWRPVVVEMSDGEKIAGKITITHDRLRIYNDSQKRYYNVPLETMSRLETLIERQYMDKKWIFLEDGRDEKVYTGETYPVRRLTHRVTFSDGKTLTGKILGRSIVLKPDGGGDPRRLTLQRKLEGEVGDKLESLVYVKAVRFRDKATGVMGSIRGTLYVPPGETPLGIIALNRSTDVSIKTTVGRGNQFKLKDCMSGVYDLLLVTDKRMYTYFSNEKEESGRRFHAGTMEEIKEWKKNIRSFFDDETPLYAGGNEKKCYVLVRMERSGKLTFGDPKKYAWVKGARRYEIWHMHKPNDQWLIEKRHFITRKLLKQKPADSPRHDLVLCPALGGHVIDQKHTELDLALKIRPAREQPIPPAPAQEKEDNGE